MVDWATDIYYSPEKFGVTLIAAIGDEDASYTFDDIVVWRHDETGKFYWGHDSGCSCPTPFENVKTLADLSPLRDADELRRFMDGEDEQIKRSLGNRNDFLRTVREAMKK